MSQSRVFSFHVKLSASIHVDGRNADGTPLTAEQAEAVAKQWSENVDIVSGNGWREPDKFTSYFEINDKNIVVPKLSCEEPKAEADAYADGFYVEDGGVYLERINDEDV
jgi:hypothetical protein